MLRLRLFFLTLVCLDFAMPIELIAAPHTPFHADGRLNLTPVAGQAEHLKKTGVSGAFVGGTTGEGHSLTVAERLSLTEQWVESGRRQALRVIVHVGHNCQADAVRLAAHAAEVQADAVALLAPSYFQPASVADLLDFCQPVAEAAGSLPFYFYDIPSMTHVRLSMTEFLAQSERRLPNLAGIKYTNMDLVQFQECLQMSAGRWEILFGCDELLLAGYALGARGAVCSTYNFMAPLYHSLISAFDSGDLATARRLQAHSIRVIRLLQTFGYPAASKYLLNLYSLDLGPVRCPLHNLTSAQQQALLDQVQRLVLCPD